jgi:AbrB family looped-hinge helix DNA binding protein
LEQNLKVGKKGVLVIPKKLREAAAISEGSEVKAELLPFGILLRPVIQNPVEVLASLPIAPRKKPSVETVRKLREKIDEEVKRKND